MNGLRKLFAKSTPSTHQFSDSIDKELSSYLGTSVFISTVDTHVTSTLLNLLVFALSNKETKKNKIDKLDGYNDHKSQNQSLCINNKPDFLLWQSFLVSLSLAS